MLDPVKSRLRDQEFTDVWRVPGYIVVWLLLPVAGLAYGATGNRALGIGLGFAWFFALMFMTWWDDLSGRRPPWWDDWTDGPFERAVALRRLDESRCAVCRAYRAYDISLTGNEVRLCWRHNPYYRPSATGNCVICGRPLSEAGCSVHDTARDTHVSQT